MRRQAVISRTTSCEREAARTIAELIVVFSVEVRHHVGKGGNLAITWILEFPEIIALFK
jgi:hypothetical protein